MEAGSVFDLSVVVVNYNTRDLLLDFLQSIYQTVLPIECIVIDNASQDGSVEAVQSAYPQTQVVVNTQNRYFSAGYTQGVMLAQGRYILVLNSDMVVKGDTLRQLVQGMEASPHIGAATTTMFFPDGRLQRNCAHFTPLWYLCLNYSFLGKLFPARLSKANEWLWYQDWDRTTPRPVESLSGSCIIARRETWQRIGGFEARMVMYFSDDYFSRQVLGLGLENHYLVSDGIIHYEGATAKKRSAWSLRIYMHDLLVYTRLVYGRVAACLLAVLIAPTYAAQRLRR